MPSGPAAGPRWGGERGRAALPGVPGNAGLTYEKGLVLPSRLWCSCAADPVKNLHVHRHMQFSRGRTRIPEHQLVTPDPAIPTCAKSSGRCCLTRSNEPMPHIGETPTLMLTFALPASAWTRQDTAADPISGMTAWAEMRHADDIRPVA